MGFTLMVALPLGLKEIWEFRGKLRERPCGEHKDYGRENLPLFPWESLELTLLSIILSVSKALGWHKSRQEP